MLLTETKIKKTRAQNTRAPLSFGEKIEQMLLTETKTENIKTAHGYFEYPYFLSLDSPFAGKKKNLTDVTENYI